MRTTLAAVFTALAFLLQAPAMGADWPMYLMDPSHSSYAAAETQITPSNVGTLQQAWTFTGKPFGGAPTIVGGVIYIGDWSGAFYAINAADGKVLWQQDAGVSGPPDNPEFCQPAIGVTGQAVVKDGIVYVPGGDSAVYAFDKTTGSQLWRMPLADPASGSYLWSSLQLVDNSLYLGVASLGDCPLVRGAAVRIDLANPPNPAVKYLVSEDDVGAGLWSTPAVDPQSNTMYITTGNGFQDADSGTWGSAFMSLDSQTFEVKGYFFLPTLSDVPDDDWGSSPTLFQAADGTPLVAATAKDGILYCLRRSDMTLFWATQLAFGCDDPQAGCGSLSTPAFDGNRLYVGSGGPDLDNLNFGSIYAIDPSTGERLWQHQINGPVIAPVTVANGVVFASTIDGVKALDAGTGAELWNDGGGWIYSQAVVVDGTVYAAYLGGTLVAYRLPPAENSSRVPRRPR
jgi:polyvinyl alcohol dehydrogenase (cytochrome)